MSHVDQSLTLIERGNALEVRSQQDYDAAGEFLTGATALDRSIESHYKPLKQAAHELHKALTVAESSQRGPLQSVINYVKGLRIGWTQRVAAEAEAEQKRLQAIIDKTAKKNGLDPVVVQVAPKLTKTEGVHSRSTWTCIVDDINKIPREYMMPDYKKLNDVAKRMKKGFNIPGAHAEENINEVVRL